MQKFLSFFFKSHKNIKRYRIGMREQNEALLLKQGKEQFTRLIEKGLRVPVVAF